MNCETAHEAISALLDWRAPRRRALRARVPPRSCATCRDWREQAHEVTRRARLAAARPVPAPDASLLAAVDAINSRRSPWATLPLLRVVILLVGLAQLALTLPELLSGSYRGAPIHVAHELGALDWRLRSGSSSRPGDPPAPRACVRSSAAPRCCWSSQPRRPDRRPDELQRRGAAPARGRGLASAAPIARLAPHECAGLPLSAGRSRLRRRAWAVARWPSSGEPGDDGNEAEPDAASRRRGAASQAFGRRRAVTA